MPHRFYLQTVRPGDTTVSITDPGLLHQITTVLRLKKGDSFSVFTGSHEYDVSIRQITKREITATVLRQKPLTTEPLRSVTLYQSLLKKDKFELILQKGTELGVQAFVPVICDHTITRDITPNKHKRYLTIIQEAAEQCGGGRVPTIDPPTHFSQALQSAKQQGGITLVAWEGEKTTTLPEVLRQLKNQHVHLFIGPEGGFSASEIHELQNSTVSTISLGPRILRAETAAIAGLSLLLLGA